MRKLKNAIIVLSLISAPLLVSAQDTGTPATAAPATPTVPPLLNPALVPLAALASGASPSTIRQLLNDQWTDLRKNTKFTLDRTQTGTIYDISNDRWLMGTSVPFAQIGSFANLAGGLFTSTTGGGKAVPMASGSVNLNSVTRPLINYGLSRVPVLQNNLPLVAALAQATTVGGAAGHDFNLDSKKKVVFNTAGVFLGFEMKYGGSALATVQ